MILTVAVIVCSTVQECVLELVVVNAQTALELVQEAVQVVLARVPGNVKVVPAALVRVRQHAPMTVQEVVRGHVKAPALQRVPMTVLVVARELVKARVQRHAPMTVPVVVKARAKVPVLQRVPMTALVVVKEHVREVVQAVLVVQAAPTPAKALAPVVPGVRVVLELAKVVVVAVPALVQALAQAVRAALPVPALVVASVITPCTATSQASVIANLGANIVRGNIIKAADFLEVKQAISKEYTRRGKSSPPAYNPAVTAGKPIKLNAISQIFDDCYNFNSSSSNDWRSTAKVGDPVYASKIQPSIDFIKGLATQITVK